MLRPAFILSLSALLVSGCQQMAAPAVPVSAAASSATHPASPTTAANAPAGPVPGSGYAAVPAAAAASETTYVFGWGELPLATARPRGGTTRGAAVTLAPERSLPLAEIVAAPDAFARDRAAILGLAGDYKTTFHFMESLGFAPNYKPTRPYHSWATEHVRVIEDTGRFISLQHTLVMFIQTPDGKVSEPMVQKHWRQDWTYQDTDLHTFVGRGTWARRRPTTTEAAGAWSQAVFQVDDSPRYEALGRWEHRGNLSEWIGEQTWRPLPRREHTIRQDYDVMEGAHRIVLTPTGWLHEQTNWKRVAGENAPTAYVGKEIGLDRYERITAPSLAAADAAWQKSAPYWALVRKVWAETFAQRERFTLRDEVDGRPLFDYHFAYAAKLEEGAPFDAADAERDVRSTLGRFIVPAGG